MVYVRLITLLLCLSVFLPQPGFARYDYRLDSREVKSGQFESEMAAKIERGATNVLFGWTEIFRTPADWASNPEHGKFQAVVIGIPYGVIRAVGRTGVGVYEMVTFFVPQEPIFYPIQGDVV